MANLVAGGMESLGAHLEHDGANSNRIVEAYTAVASLKLDILAGTPKVNANQVKQ